MQPHEAELNLEPDLGSARARYARQLEEALEAIVAKLRQDTAVRRISVFGSYARGRRDLFTDLDVMVVMDTAKPFVERLGDLYAGLSSAVDLDLICYTPAEFAALKDRGFLRSALAGEMVVFERAA
jgi:predicted nucleotidyltransferase